MLNFGFAASAATEKLPIYNAAWASFMAKDLNELKSRQDLLAMVQKNSDRESLSEEIKGKEFEKFVPAKVMMPTPTKLEINYGKSISSMDFKEFHENMIYVNDKPIKLNEKKSYYDYRDWETDRKSTRLNSSHEIPSRMPSSA